MPGICERGLMLMFKKKWNFGSPVGIIGALKFGTIGVHQQQQQDPGRQQQQQQQQQQQDPGRRQQQKMGGDQTNPAVLLNSQIHLPQSRDFSLLLVQERERERKRLSLYSSCLLYTSPSPRD